MSAKQAVLNKLNSRKSKGVTHQQFPAGFSLRSRIADLRATGYTITTTMVDNSNNNGKHAVYRLIATPEAK